MLNIILTLAAFVVARLQAEAAKLRRRADSQEDAAETLYQASLAAETKAAELRREAGRVQRVAQKLDGALK